jgi:hypothetical protein
MSRTYYIPTVLLRCSKCHNQTPHLLIDFENKPKFGITLTYECQMCGETKKAFDLNTLPEFTPEIEQSVANVASAASTPAKEETKAPLIVGTA